MTFPQSEIGADPKVIPDYAQAAEDLGYEHPLAYHHVLGADPSNREGWRGYTHETMFHEPLTLFCYRTPAPYKECWASSSASAVETGLRSPSRKPRSSCTRAFPRTVSAPPY